MPALQSVERVCARRAQAQLIPYLQSRQLSYSTSRSQEVTSEPQEPTQPTQPTHIPKEYRVPYGSVGTKGEEKILKQRGLTIVGSRRRRAAIRDSSGVPFEQLPYQCFQEARKILAEDRTEKLGKIEVMRSRIAEVESKDVSEFAGAHSKKGKLVAMNKHLAELKVQADLHDPLIKKRFEDGLGDMDRPIYRHLADKKWRSYKKLLMEQRLTQMKVIPDVLPHLDLSADITMNFSNKLIQPGEIVNSRMTEMAPTLDIQVFDRGPRLVTIALIDPDVPDVDKDGFNYRCHYLATNIELSPSKPQIELGNLPAENVALPWLPPFSQKGIPYQRLAFFILRQPEGKTIDTEKMRQQEQRLGFNLRSFNDRYRLKAVSATMFRTAWDENTSSVMKRAGLEGADVEYKRKTPEALPDRYKVKDGKRYR